MTLPATHIDPYYGQPGDALLAARDALFADIASRPTWHAAFAKGRMTGLLLAAAPGGGVVTLKAYSGTMQLDDEARRYFVPPVYDLDAPGDFYRTGEGRITAISHRIARLEAEAGPADAALARLRAERAERSAALQRDIFSHFVMRRPDGLERDLTDIFRTARRSLPPGGTGECAAPRLLQYASLHGLRPLAMAEFWYGASPTGEARVHGCWYPSCMEKCAPILAFMLPPGGADMPAPCAAHPRILHEDADIVVVDKPAGMLSVPGKDAADGDATACRPDDVESWLLRRYPDSRAPMLVHRLDMATSGLLVAARNPAAHKRLQSQFMSRAVWKRYVALLDGRLPSACGTLCLPLCPNPDDRPRQVVDFHFGKTALTRYEVLARSQAGTLVAFYPLTGRTHQLRVHAADARGLNCPIVGDTLYNKKYAQAGTPAPRLMLHAQRIRFYHPATGRIVDIMADLPQGTEFAN